MADEPRFKNLPNCGYRILYGDFWEKMFNSARCRSICGNTEKVPYCPLRNPKGLCDKKTIEFCKDCGCCFWCRKSKIERGSGKPSSVK